jgi:hypothetical protein
MTIQDRGKRRESEIQKRLVCLRVFGVTVIHSDLVRVLHGDIAGFCQAPSRRVYNSPRPPPLGERGMIAQPHVAGIVCSVAYADCNCCPQTCGINCVSTGVSAMWLT